jgi:hypothetical protein
MWQHASPSRRNFTLSFRFQQDTVGYAIRAVVEKDGKRQVREQAISLKGGELREVSINFENASPEQVPTKSMR